MSIERNWGCFKAPAMLAAAVGTAGLAGRFDAVLSVEEVGAFKPDRRVYQLAVDRLGISAAAIAFVRRGGPMSGARGEVGDGKLSSRRLPRGGAC